MASTNLTEDSNKKDANVDIAVNGDVAFIVGPSCRRLRVYSLVLTNASTVFNVMLGPHFKEGHQLAQTGLTEIELPEDNAEAVEIVFNIIHGRNDRVSDSLDPDELLQVAIIIDKYDCLVPLAFAIKLWLKSVSVADPVQMWTLAMVGVILRREETFAEAASALILNYSETYLSLTNMYGELPDQIIQLRIAAMLEDRRSKLRIRLFEDMLAGDWHCSCRNKKSGHRPDWLAEFTRRVGSLNQRPISSILESLRQGIDTTSDEWGYMNTTSMNHIFQSIADSCENHHMNEGGLCLWCVMAEGPHEGHK